MSYETIEFAQEGGVARLTLNRPDRLNSFTVRMHEEVADALGKLSDARCLVLTGAGAVSVPGRIWATARSRRAARQSIWAIRLSVTGTPWSPA